MKPLLLGYHDVETLPIRKGETITIPKGTLYTYRGKLVDSKRSYKVKVDHVLAGWSIPVGWFMPLFGDVHFNYLNRQDHGIVQSVYGLDYKLEELWPLMTVRNGDILLPLSNPEVSWARSGGYWACADINQFSW